MIRVVIADDHDMVRAGFKMILEKDPEIKVVGEAAEGAQAYALVAREKPDVLLLDISMPEGKNGLVTCDEVVHDFPDTKVLIVTMFEEPEYLSYTLKGGAAGYLLKNAAAAEMHKAVKTVCQGHTYIHPKMKSLMSQESGVGAEEDANSLHQLSVRELEILQLLAKGFTNKEISDRIFLSVKTVEAHRSKIYAKLDLKTRADLVDYAIKHKLLSI